MSNKALRKAIPLMHTLKSLKPAQRTILLEHLDTKAQKKLYRALDKVIRSSSTPLKHKKKLKKVLSPHKNELRFLTNAGNPLRLKKKKLMSMGGQFGAILGAAIPILLDLIIKGR